MSNIEKMSISLTSEMAAMVRASVATGDYASTSEVVRDALRLWQRQQHSAGDAMIEAIGVEKVRKLWEEGLASGPALPGNEVFAALRARYE